LRSKLKLSFLEGASLGALVGAGLCVLFIICMIFLREPVQKSARKKSKKVVDVGLGGERRVRITERKSYGPTSAEDVAAANLESLLKDLRKARNPGQRAIIVTKVQRRFDELSPPLLDILGTEEHHLLLPAIFLASALKQEDAVSPLTHLTQSGPLKIQVAALIGAHAIEPWSEGELLAFLNSTQVPKLVAVLELLAQRKSRPLAAIFEMLAYPDQRVRSAAVRAVPRLQADSEPLLWLCKRVQKSKGKAAVAAVLAIGRAGVPEGSEECLVERFSSRDWRVRRAALNAIANMGRPISNPECVLSILRGKDLPLKEGACAFIALERTRTLPVDKLRAMVPNLHPLLRMFAARCLVAAGDKSAVPVLIDLLSTQESVDVDDEAAVCARESAHQILTEICNKDLGTDVEPWQRWHRKLASLAPRDLRLAAPTFW
jgi:hypothetical protein